MKVKDYIELLKQFPQDLEIAQEYDSMYFTPNEPKKMRMIEDSTFANTFLEVSASDNKENVIECVVI